MTNINRYVKINAPEILFNFIHRYHIFVPQGA